MESAVGGGVVFQGGVEGCTTDRSESNSEESAVCASFDDRPLEKERKEIIKWDGGRGTKSQRPVEGDVPVMKRI
jgi:hypothetical protein